MFRRAPFAELWRRVAMMVARGVLKRVTDTGRLQVLQLSLMADEAKDGVERFQEYGFTSYPKQGAEAVVLFAAGNRDHGLVIAVDDRRYRLKPLAQGEVALYDDQGQKIVLHRDRIEVTAPKVVVKSDNVRLGGEGGEKVARIGDMVQVTGGSSAGLHPIVDGSSKVFAVD